MVRRAYITPDEAPVSYRCRALLVPEGQTWLAIFYGALLELCDAANYEQVSGVTPDVSASVFFNTFMSIDGGCPMFAGMVTLAARAVVPGDSWLECDGSDYLISQYPALYNAIGDAFGDNGEGTFCVPDMRGLFPRGAGSGVSLAETGGEATHVLTESEMPSHQHQLDLIYSTGTALGIPLTGQPGTDGGDLSTKATGGGQAHNTIPPFLGLNFFIFTGV